MSNIHAIQRFPLIKMPIEFVNRRYRNEENLERARGPWTGRMRRMGSFTYIK